MIKECPVIMTNQYVTVVRYEDRNVQLPSIKNAPKTIKVAFEHGHYFAVDDSYIDFTKQNKARNNKRAKKTTKSTATLEVNNVAEDVCKNEQSD